MDNLNNTDLYIVTKPFITTDFFSVYDKAEICKYF